MATVESLHIKIGSRLPMRGLDAVRIVADFGLEGDANARPGSLRQVLMIPAETLEGLALPPGAAKENIVTRGLDLHDLPRGTLLRVGGARLELTLPCSPCKHLDDDVRPGLSDEMRGQRGMLFRVLEGGEVHVGDEITVVV